MTAPPSVPAPDESDWRRFRTELLLLRRWLSTLAERLAAADPEGQSGAAELAAEALAAAERFDHAFWRFEHLHGPG